MPYFNPRENVEIFYKFHKKDLESETIVFIHEYGSSMNDFSQQVKMLKDSFNIILMDAEDHGNSLSYFDYTINSFLTQTVEDFHELALYLNVRFPIIVIGHGLFGNAVAQQFAIDNPSAVSRIILLNGGNIIMDDPIRNIFWNLLPDKVRFNYEDISPTQISALIKELMSLIVDLLNQGENQKYYKDIQNIEEYILNDLTLFWSERIESYRINCPCYIISGELDNISSFKMSKSLQKSIITSEHKVIDMGGHFGLYERYEEYNKFILKFLKPK